MKRISINLFIKTICFSFFLFLEISPLGAQLHNSNNGKRQVSLKNQPVRAYQATQTYGFQSIGDKLEDLYGKYLDLNVLKTVQEKTGASKDEMTVFTRYYKDKIDEERNAFLKGCNKGTINNDADVQLFANNKIDEYVQLFAKFKDIEKDYPSSVSEYATPNPLPPAIVCQVPCDNIDFENGTQSGWYTYYATNTSPSGGPFSNSAPVGGLAGAVTRSANDPTSGTDQVVITSGPGLDPIAGAFLPVVCPTGGNYSVRLGDSTVAGAQMAILEQKFTVSNANKNFVFMYAVVLENPSHNNFQQPYFKVQTFDKNNNLIPGCGEYDVVSGPGLPGYKAFYYAPDADTVYVKPWTTVYLPLQKYVGTCVTIKVTVADCALGGHFGYAYFDAACSPGIISNSPVICGNNVTLNAPSGAASYAWSGPCIVGPANTQNATISCAGTYTCVLTSAAGPSCSDTLTINVPSSTSPTPTISSSTNIKCNGGATGSATVNVTGGTAPYTYLWTPSGGNGATASNLTAGTYTCTVHDVNGCVGSVSVTLTQPPVLTANITATTNVKCNGASTGSATVTAGGGTVPYTYNWAPSGGTNATASNLPANSYTVTVTDKNGCTATALANITQPTALTATISSTTNVKCHGGATGSATVNASGGVPAYTYNWTPSGGSNATASNLTAGTYTITVTDANGCTATASAVIGQPATLTVSTSITNEVSCNGGSDGSANAIAGGGTVAYTYNWTPSGGTNASVNNLTAGTYTITVIDKNGCTATATAVITQPTVLTANITATTNVKCNGGTNGSATVAAGGGTVPYTYNWAPSGGSGATANNLGAGTYTVTVTDKNGCTATAQATITQPAGLTASISSTTDVKCNGGATGSATVAAGGGTVPYTYNWTPSGGSNATASNLTAGTYTITVTDKNGCSATASTTITQPAVLTASISSSTNINCNGAATGSATVNAGGGTVAYTYNWTPSGGSNATASNLTAGTYTATVTDKNGCTATTSVVITQPTALTASISASTNVSCNGGNNGSATVTAGGGTPAYVYNWTPGAQTNATASNLTAGTYTITVTDAGGCTATASVVITQPTVLTANITATTNEKCNGASTGSATVTAGGGTIPYAYNWTPSGGTNTTASNISAGTYTITVTDKNGCTATASATITQPTAISIVTSFTSATCGSSNGSATANPSGGTPGYGYNWAPSGGTNATASNISAGSYTVTVTDANNCTATANVSVPNSSGPSVSIASSVNENCFGGATGSATGSVSGGTPPYTYNWTPNGGTSITASNLTAGTYNLNVTDKNGCVGVASVTITQPAAIVVSTVSVTDVKCNGGATGGATISAAGGTPAYTYNWTPSGGSGASATNLTAGTYTCTVTDKSGCTGSTSVTITQPVVLTVTTTHVNEPCNGDASGSATANPAGGTPAYTYNWTPSGGSGVTATGLTAGSYTITVTDANGCTATAKATVTQPAKLTANITASTNVSCNGGNNGSATVTAGGGTTPYTYNWTPSGGNGATANNLTAGTYTITVTDKKGCTATASVIITEPATLTANITATTNVKCNGGNNGSATVTAGGGTIAYTYAWAPSGGSSANATGLTAGSYTVTVTDKNGCTATANTTITQPAVLTANASVTANVNCNGGNNGSATVAVGGGTVAYTYAWTPSGGNGANATGLTAGGYTITVTDANGCTATDNVTISQPSTLTETITSVVPVSCNGGSNGSAFANVNGGTLNYNYNWTPSGGTNATANNLTAGTYTCTTMDANGCSVTASVNITQPATLTSPITSTTNISCNGAKDGSATVTAGGGTTAYTYNWSPGGATTASITGIGPGTYTITVTDANGCISSASTTITEPPVLTASINSSTPVSCNGGNNGSATITVGGGTPAYNYNWVPSGGNSATATGLSAGTYTCNVTDSHGCAAFDITTITQPPVLTASVNYNVGVNCNGGSDGSAAVNVGGGTPGYMYNWTSGATSDTATSLSAGNYTVTVTDANGCTATASTTITQPTPLTANITANVPVGCNGGSNGSATVTPGGGTTPYTYLWTGGGGTNATAINLIAGSYTVYVWGAHGCADSASVVITQPNALSVNTSVISSTCKNSNGSATAIVSGGTIAYTYKWTPGGATTATATGLSAGTYSVLVTDAHGCIDSANAIVTDLGAGTASISPSINVSCYSGNNGSAMVNMVGGSSPFTYNWSNGASTINITGLTAGTYSVIVTDKNGCTSDAFDTITQPTLLVTDLSSTQPVCGNSNGTVSAVVSGGTPGYTYTWSNGATTTSIAGLSGGLYYVIVKDNNGCSDSAAVTLVNKGAVVPVISASTNVSCNGGNNGSATVNASGGTLPYTYNWTPAGGTSATISGLTAGTYTINVTDSNNCSTTTSVTISQPQQLKDSISSTSTICSSSCSGTATAHVSGGTLPYTYLWNNGATTTSLSALCAGTYIVTVKDSGGCSNIDSVKIPFSSGAISAGFEPTPDTIPGGEFVSFLNLSKGANAWFWTFGDGSNSVDSFPYHQYTVAGTYIVYQKVSNSFGCTDSISDTVVVTEGINIPNVFTPNGDGINDVFHITAANMKDYSIHIYSRWGQEVFNTTDPNIDWTGRSNSGVEESVGSYYYVLKATSYSNVVYDRKGYVQLLR